MLADVLQIRWNDVRGRYQRLDDVLVQQLMGEPARGASPRS
jgi:hypothetical protein